MLTFLILSCVISVSLATDPRTCAIAPSTPGCEEGETQTSVPRWPTLVYPSWWGTPEQSMYRSCDVSRELQTCLCNAHFGAAHCSENGFWPKTCPVPNHVTCPSDADKTTAELFKRTKSPYDYRPFVDLSSYSGMDPLNQAQGHIEINIPNTESCIQGMLHSDPKWKEGCENNAAYNKALNDWFGASRQWHEPMMKCLRFTSYAPQSSDKLVLKKDNAKAATIPGLACLLNAQAKIGQCSNNLLSTCQGYKNCMGEIKIRPAHQTKINMQEKYEAALVACYKF